MSDTNLGMHFAPHKPNCRCDDCHMERLQTQNMALKTKLAAAEADAETEREKVRVLREALEDLLAYVETGYGDFESDEGELAHEALAITEDV